MWEILNVIPVIEVNSLTPEERLELERRAVRDLQRQLDFQDSLNQTPAEFFAEKPSPKNTGE